MSMPPLLLLAEPLPAGPTNWAALHCRIVRCGVDEPEFPLRLAEADALVVRTATHVDATLLEQARRLQVIGRAGVGLDNIDIDACRRHDVTVVHTPDANADAVVEYLFWLIGDAIRPRAALHAPLDRAGWERTRVELTATRQLRDCTIGILGLGRIGRRVAKVAAAFGARTLYCDLLDIPTEIRHGAAPVDCATLFSESDIVSIHVDGRATNRHLVDRSLLARLKPDAIIVNTARGSVVDASALADRLRERPNTIALLDVHDPEPIVVTSPLWGLSNCHLFPHLASRTDAATEAMGWVVRDVVAVLQGRPPEHPAAPDMRRPRRI